jgi:hypothetical protein
MQSNHDIHKILKRSSVCETKSCVKEILSPNFQEKFPIHHVPHVPTQCWPVLGSRLGPDPGLRIEPNESTWVGLRVLFFNRVWVIRLVKAKVLSLDKI